RISLHTVLRLTGADRLRLSSALTRENLHTGQRPAIAGWLTERPNPHRNSRSHVRHSAQEPDVDSDTDETLARRPFWQRPHLARVPVSAHDATSDRHGNLAGERGQRGQGLALVAWLVPSASGLGGCAQAFKNELTVNINSSGLSIQGKWPTPSSTSRRAFVM